VNKRPVRVVRNGQPENILSEQIRVGDVIYLTKDETAPCDAVVLATSHQVPTPPKVQIFVITNIGNYKYW
jgi:magnesium-transporting ATPase (P-type)